LILFSTLPLPNVAADVMKYPHTILATSVIAFLVSVFPTWTAKAVNVAPSFTLPTGVTTPAGITWTARESSRFWWSITSSADGSKLAAVEYGGQIYTSTDSGTTWTPRESNRIWISITSSADGSKLAAVVYGGQIYTSTNSGTTWTPRESNRNWSSITSSADGSKLAAVVQNGLIYTSTDSGATWTAQASGSSSWVSITSSSDGNKLAAVVFNGQIYTSTDSGATWTPRDSNRFWNSIASSADGSKLAAVNGQIYTSTNSGVTWTLRDSFYNCNSITSSADGSKLAAAVQGGQIYTSADSGVNWTAQASGTPPWRTITSSADGSKLAAAVQGGQIYTSVASTAPYNVSVTAGSGLSTTANFAANISPGPAADAGQTVSFTVSNDNTSLFTTQPAIASNGTLTFTPGTTVGVATLTVTAVDNGGTANGGVDSSAPQTFTINVTAPPAPTVTTPTSTSITRISAILGGNVTSDGGATITERGVVYSVTSTNSNPRISGTGVTKVSTTGTTGLFTLSSGTLTPGTAYSFAAYATNSTGTGYSDMGSFTTAASVSSLILTNATPTNAWTVNWTLAFEAAVTGVTASNFSLSGTGTSLASVGTPTTGNGGLSWNVPVTTGGSGTLTLSLANATGLSPSVSTTLPFTGQTCTVDKVTTTPTLTTPASDGTSKNPVSVSYNLPEAAQPGSVNLTFAGASTVTLTLSGSNSTAGAHSFSFNPANLGASTDIASATAGFIADGSYTVTLSYQDLVGNPAASSRSAASFLIDTLTVTPTLTAPASNALTGSPFGVSFSLPETALASSVQLVFSGSSSIAVTLAASQATAGSHSFTLDATNLLGSSNVASASASTIPNGTYTVALSYQDLLGNAASSSIATNFTIASAPTVTSPTSASITALGATLGGNVTSDGGATITERGVVYSVTSTNNNPTDQRHGRDEGQHSGNHRCLHRQQRHAHTGHRLFLRRLCHQQRGHDLHDTGLHLHDPQ